MHIDTVISPRTRVTAGRLHDPVYDSETRCDVDMCVRWVVVECDMRVMLFAVSLLVGNGTATSAFLLTCCEGPTIKLVVAAL